MANQGWTVDYETLEIGSLGHYQKEMRPLLSSALDLHWIPKDQHGTFWTAALKLPFPVLIYQIFLARNSPSWSTHSLLTFYNYFFLLGFFLPCLTSLCTCTVRVLCARVREFVTLCMSFQVFPPCYLRGFKISCFFA